MINKFTSFFNNLKYFIFPGNAQPKPKQSITNTVLKYNLLKIWELQVNKCVFCYIHTVEYH